jgi:hypothetical protein
MAFRSVRFFAQGEAHEERLFPEEFWASWRAGTAARRDFHNQILSLAAVLAVLPPANATRGIRQMRTAERQRQIQFNDLIVFLKAGLDVDV